MFCDSLKFSRDIDVTISFILSTIQEKLAINNTVLFGKIKNVIQKTDNDATKILNIIIDTHNKLLCQKIYLDGYCDVIFYKYLDKMIQSISEEDRKIIFHHFNTPVNIFKFSNLVNDISQSLSQDIVKKIINIFTRFYIKKIKYTFSSLMSILYKNKFNHIDIKHIEKLILFIEAVTHASSGNKQIDGFVHFCKKEILKTIANVDIVKHFSHDDYKKIISLLPEVKNNFTCDIKINSANKYWKEIICPIRHDKKALLDKMKKINNYDLFGLLNYAYLQKQEDVLLKDIFVDKLTNEHYEIVNIIFKKILSNKNVNIKKISVIIDYVFINQLKNLCRLEHVFEYVLQTVDFVSVFYGTKLKQYFFTYKTEQENIHNDNIKDNKEKIYDFYICNISELLQTNNIETSNKLKKIESIIIEQEKNKNNIKTFEIAHMKDQKELLQEAHTTRVCLEEHIKKIYIRNGGLVIMWPFFYDLFEKQHLLDEYNKKIFKNDIARYNAIHVLQYLVSCQYNNPDWKVILNKLLCGFKHDDVVMSGYLFGEKKIMDTEENHLSQKELEFKIKELQHNTDMAIGECLCHWPEINVLSRTEGFSTGMNINNFRNYFLRRDAFLNIIEQKYDNGIEYNYILDISNKEYDEYVKSIPWNMHKICLPWMLKPIYVRNFDISSKKD
ncbi:MAG: hypothetical protein II393_00735 [Cytophagales bacterium]|nr:hypothetical protein [Cytophagales bacterium]